MSQANFCRCYEIVQWALHLDIDLPTVFNEEFLRLIISHGNEDLKEKFLSKRKIKSDYTLKF